jgi:hypothetical protein
MKLDEINLPGATKSDRPVKTLASYPFAFADGGAIEEISLGIRRIMVSGIFKTKAERDALEQYCEAGGEKKLYFPSEEGSTTDDRYYKVITGCIQYSPVQDNASVYSYSFEAYAGDPSIYDVATDEVIW